MGFGYSAILSSRTKETKLRNMNNGVFLISLDFEMWWGIVSHGQSYLKAYEKNIRCAVDVVRRIIDLCMRYDIKVTIGYVGAMTEQCLDDFLQNQTIAPKYKNRLLSTYERVPELHSLFKDAQLFCKDFIDYLKTVEGVELATHTYSHYFCLEEGQNIVDFDNDIKKATELHAGTFDSIIFPRNQVAPEYLEVCARYGIRHWRSILEDKIHRTESSRSHFSVKGALRLLDTYIPITGPKCFCRPVEENGIVNVPGSMFLRPYSKKLRFLEPFKIMRIKYCMKHAAKNGMFYHLWWHPHNFGANTEENLAQLEDLCKYFKKLQSKYGMQSYFMKDL